MATHKSGNQLDLIYTRHRSTGHVLVTPLHTSDHFLLTLNFNMIPDTSHTPPHVTFPRSHPPGYLLWFHLRVLPLNRYHILMVTVLLTLSVPLWCLVLKTFCSLSARSTPSAPWLSVILLQHRSKLSLSSHPTSPLDPIPSHLLQTISPAVVPALTHIVNTSLHTGIFPSAFKQARITPF